MKRQLKAVLVSNTVHIDTTQIPEYIRQNIAQAALRAIQRDYADPEIYADYLRWKKEQEMKGSENHEC